MSKRERKGRGMVHRQPRDRGLPKVPRFPMGYIFMNEPARTSGSNPILVMADEYIMGISTRGQCIGRVLGKMDVRICW